MSSPWGTYTFAVTSGSVAQFDALFSGVTFTTISGSIALSAGLSGATGTDIKSPRTAPSGGMLKAIWLADIADN